MAERVLVTGFEPFGMHTTNISGDVALSLSGKTVRGHTIEAMVLPVDEKGSKIVSDLVKNRKFAANDWADLSCMGNAMARPEK